MQMIEGVLRILFSLLDRIVIILTNLSYDLLVKISSLNIVDMDVIEGFNKRLGLILGIFMLFNIAVQILNYIVSPDKISDKGNGNAGKLILNIVLSLALLVTVNHIFTVAYKVQFKILEKQIIPQLVFGTKPTTQKLDHYAGEISYYVYSAMMPINTKVTENCSDVYITGIKGECGDSLKTILGNDTFNKFKSVIESKDASEFMDYDIMNAKYEGKYVFDYTLLFSTVIGVIVFLILVGFCIDVATRSIKLYFYQVIAPVPIIANMVPGKGQETFKKWYKACISTYLDVFIRLIALFFATFMIITVVNSLGTSLSGHHFLTVFIILGALIFAKQIPQIIQDLTGIKLDGQFSLNPLKKIENQALFGKNLTGLAAGATVGTIGALSGAGRAQGLKGGFLGLVRGKGFGETWKNQISSNKNMRQAIANGSTFWGRRFEQLTGALGISTPVDTDERRIKEFDDQLAANDEELGKVTKQLEPLKSEMSVLDTLQNLKSEMEKRAESKILKGDSQYSKDVIEAQSKIDTLKSSAANLRDYVKSKGGSEADYENEFKKLNAEIAAATTEYNKKLKDSREKYIEDALNGRLINEKGENKPDAYLDGIISDYNEKIDANRSYNSIRGLDTIGTGTSFSKLDAQDTNITNSNQKIKHSTYGLEREKSSLEEVQRDIQQQKKEYQNQDSYKRHQANKNALGGK